jgi:TP901 family phage tail tape measure protein
MSKFVLTAQLQLQAPNNVKQVVQQIQSQLNGVSVNIQVQNAGQAQKQIQQVAQATNQATTAAERMGKAFALSIRRFAAFSIATRAVGLFTSTLSDAVQTSIDFERQLIKVSQVTGKSLTQLRGLTKQITDLSTGFGVASSDLLNVSTILAQAGLSAEDTAVALKTLAKSALAPNFDSITETAEGAIAVLAQFKEGVGSLEKQLGSINAVAGAFAVEAGDLIDVIRRTGGVFKASGGDLNELLALFTSVRATTRESAESIGTGLRTIFTRIQRPKTIEFLKQFGVELVDLNGKFVGPYEAIKKLSEALAGLGEGDTTFIRIAEELGGFRQIGKVLPLLQQFSTAQSALNVAMKAGDSLTQDAASSQAALAIRIMKVKEEFLALVRSITETSTFQVMANTALSLASALIKIGDSIKPLLPMLAALTAFKLVKGMGSFFGGMMSGAASGRTYNKGGKVLGFARGGLVPGSGNGDTVPAMLAPGEFVIRKSSVNKMGAGTLAAMNNNRYAAGGIATQSNAGMAVGDLLNNQKPDTATAINGSASVNARSVLTATPGIPPLGNSSLLQRYSGNTPKGQLDAIMSQALGFGSKIYQTKAEGVTKDEYQAFNNALGPAIENAVIQSAGQLANSMGVSGASPPTFTEDFRKSLPKGLIGSLFEIILDSFNDKPISGSESRRPFDFTRGVRPIGSMYRNLAGINYVDAKVSPGHRGTNISSDEFTKKINNQLALDVFDDYIRLINNQTEFMGPMSSEKSVMPRTIDAFKGKKAVQAHLGGLIQKFAEGGEVINQGTEKYLASDVVKAMRELQGNPSLSEKDAIDLFTSRNDRGDFIYTSWGGKGSIKPPKWLTTYKPPQSAAYGRWQQNQANNQNRIASSLAVRGKTMRDYEGRREFAAGGGVGTDTVPALLTPGEFVVNRSSAQKIGYGALNRMNKVGKYASGGVVQHFAAGGGVTSSSVKSSISGLADNKAIQSEIAATSQEMKKTGNYLKILSTSLDKQGKITNALYQESSALDGRISNYDKVLATLAAQQGKAAATGPAANKILKMKIDAESKRIEIDKKAIAEEQKLEGIKKKHAVTIDKQTQLMDRQSALIAQAKSNKQAATTAVTSTLQGGTQSNFREADRQQSYTQARIKNRERQSQSPSSGGLGGMMPKDIGGAAIAVSMVTASLQAMLPPLDENSSALTKLSHSFLGIVTTLAGVLFALQAFGIELKSQSIMKFFGGSGLGTGAKKGILSASQGLGFGRDSSVAIMKTVNAVTQLAGPLLAIAGGAYLAQEAFKIVAESIYNFDGRLKKSIESGDVEGAKKVALEKANFEKGAGGAGGVLSATAAGAAIGSIIPVLGTAVGAAAGAIVGFSVGLINASQSFLTTTDSVVALAAAQAGAVKTQKSLEEAQKVSTEAMSDFEKGTISASDALAKIRAKSGEANAQMDRASSFAKENVKNRSNAYSDSGFLRNVGALGGLNPFMETTGARNTRLGKESADQINSAAKQQQEAFNIEAPARQAAIRSGVARGKSTNEVKAEATKGLLAGMKSQQALGRDLALKGDEQGAKAAFAAAAQMEEQLKQVNKEIENIEKEVKRQKELYNALNLGLRSATATATALSASMSKFSAGLEVGGSSFVNDVEFLQSAMSSAAQAMDSGEIQSAVKGVSDNLREFGSSEKYIQKFEGNVAAFTKAQSNYTQAFANIKKSMKAEDFKGLNANKLKDKFAEELTKDMGNGEAKENLKKVIQSLELEPGDVDKIIGGDLSAFGDKLTESQQKMLEPIMKISQERAKAEQVLIDFTKKRIDSERNLVAAQQEALDLVMEGREIQGKYGGQAVTGRERKDNLLAKSNVESSRLGLTNMKSGDVGDLRRRNAEIMAGFSNIEGRRTQQGGMEKRSGVEADEAQKDLQKAYKTQIDTIRGLIKLEEEQLKITQEKNKLEKDSMESLIKGDVEDFFKKQSAVGATAAIASGDTRLQNLYGADALGMASQDIQRQQEAGVQSLYGQQLAGAGGLSETAANAALSSRGVTDMRAAQVMAGTTAEEEASKARLRELGGMLGETGNMGTQMAEMQVETATINVNSADLKFKEVMAKGNKAAAEAQAIEDQKAMSRGGMVYASRGIFVPRGTDTIPAMLTPGEFVVNRGAVQRGNNLQILQAMNSGLGGVSSSGGTALMASGGVVRYRGQGSNGPEQQSQGMSNFATALENFNRELSKNVESLRDSKITIKLDSTNVNINLNDGGLLKAVTSQVKQEIFNLVKTRLVAGDGGRLKENSGVV